MTTTTLSGWGGQQFDGGGDGRHHAVPARAGRWVVTNEGAQVAMRGHPTEQDFSGVKALRTPGKRDARLERDCGIMTDAVVEQPVAA